MIDVQGGSDDRRVALDEVGVRSLSYPVRFVDEEGWEQQTVANVEAAVRLPHQCRGTHMSRFVEILVEHAGEVSLRRLPELVQALQGRMQAEGVGIRLDFPIFLARRAPVSGRPAAMGYRCSVASDTWSGSLRATVEIQVPVSSVCPCSKAISDYGAHNQRALVTIRARLGLSNGVPRSLALASLIDAAESSASSRVYPLLKRDDERHVTMVAYDNPAFVEDIVRNVVCRLRSCAGIVEASVEVVSQESIHAHDAYARTVWTRPVGSASRSPGSGSTLQDYGIACAPEP